MKRFEFKLKDSDRPFLRLLKNNSPEQFIVLMSVHSELEGIDQRNMLYEVVAYDLNIPVNTVKSRLSRARHKILTWRNGVETDGAVQGVQGTEDPTVV